MIVAGDGGEGRCAVREVEGHDDAGVLGAGRQLRQLQTVELVNSSAQQHARHRWRLGGSRDHCWRRRGQWCLVSLVVVTGVVPRGVGDDEKGGMTTGVCTRCKVRAELLITLIATTMMPVMNATKVTVLRFEVRGR